MNSVISYIFRNMGTSCGSARIHHLIGSANPSYEICVLRLTYLLWQDFIGKIYSWPIKPLDTMNLLVEVPQLFIAFAAANENCYFLEFTFS